MRFEDLCHHIGPKFHRLMGEVLSRLSYVGHRSDVPKRISEATGHQCCYHSLEELSGEHVEICCECEEYRDDDAS